MIRFKNVDSCSEVVKTSQGVYFVNMRHNGYTNHGEQKLDVTIIRVNSNYEPRGNYAVTMHRCGDNAATARAAVDFIENKFNAYFQEV